jgi:hypothetical protein
MVREKYVECVEEMKRMKILINKKELHRRDGSWQVDTNIYLKKTHIHISTI